MIRNQPSIWMRLMMWIFQPNIERVAGLVCFVLVFIIVSSIWMYEVDIGRRGVEEEERMRKMEDFEEYLVEQELLIAKHKLEELKREQAERRIFLDDDPLLQQQMKDSERSKGERIDHSKSTGLALTGSPELSTQPRIVNPHGGGDMNPHRGGDARVHPTNKYKKKRLKSTPNKSVSNGLGGDPLGALQGGPAQCKIYSTREELKGGDDYNCIPLAIKPVTYVCLFPLETDSHVSFALARDGMWEAHIVKYFRKLLLEDIDLGVYDIGANIGVYSMLAATMGHKVVAVEPYLPSLKRLHKAIKLGKLEDKVILMQNAVSNVRETFELRVPSENQGGAQLTSQDADRFCTDPAACPPHATTIFIDDLLEVTNFKRAVMKIDIEGYENRAFVMSEQLFQAVHVEYILMEWRKMREYYGSEVDESENKSLTFELVDLLFQRGYVPHGSVLLDVLSQDYWYGWPDDIIWVHHDVSVTR